MVKREFFNKKIEPFIGKDVIKVLTGLRRSGKSFFLNQIRETMAQKGIPVKNIIAYNFEDMKYSHLLQAEALHSDVTEQIKDLKGKVYLFFDEIQEVENWERCINSLNSAYDTDIFITGSNAKLLSGDLATLIAGRYVEIRIYPFSFNEFSEMYEVINPDETDVQKVFRDYVIFGGMPFLSNLELDRSSSFQYLNDVFNSVILKDVVKRNNIRDVDMLERVIRYVLSNVGNTFSATSISRFLKSERRKVAPETILNYIKVCEEAFLFHRVLREDVVGKRILQVSEKYYATDHGLREAVCGNNEKDINLILENIVFMEMLRRGYKINIGRIGNEEIDFVCRKGNEKVYIQVAYILSTEKTIKREFGVLKKVPDNFAKFVVSTDMFDLSRDGIKHLNIVDFLEDSSSTTTS